MLSRLFNNDRARSFGLFLAGEFTVAMILIAIGAK